MTLPQKRHVSVLRRRAIAGRYVNVFAVATIDRERDGQWLYRCGGRMLAPCGAAVVGLLSSAWKLRGHAAQADVGRQESMAIGLRAPKARMQDDSRCWQPSMKRRVGSLPGDGGEGGEATGPVITVSEQSWTINGQAAMGRRRRPATGCWSPGHGAAGQQQHQHQQTYERQRAKVPGRHGGGGPARRETKREGGKGMPWPRTERDRHTHTHTHTARRSTCAAHRGWWPRAQPSPSTRAKWARPADSQCRNLALT
ncbi:hypothetical protein FH972_022211 [Carpinus fangiana]|uniref:Uncharacterized protein n=1 Tax=Carpinus fangiana TaxID=176857 RepID=A0A5N6KRX9_9ROSI|nr:hypothetical protein FH972_022211 [Carpinus fangiana]